MLSHPKEFRVGSGRVRRLLNGWGKRTEAWIKALSRTLAALECRRLWSISAAQSPNPTRARVRSRSRGRTANYLRPISVVEHLEHRRVLSFDVALLDDINKVGNDSGITDLIQVGSPGYFIADDLIHGHELWVTDGTSTGTRLVKDINPGPGRAFGDFLAGTVNLNPGNLTNVNGTVFFAADDGVHGRELWKSDGTVNGTLMVADLLPGVSSGFQESFIFRPQFENVNGLLFFVANDASHGKELWTTDGTPGGTSMVKDIDPNTSSFFGGPADLINVNGTLYFVADDGSGYELWRSDGTINGTRLVRDINTAVGVGSSPDSLVNVNGTLYFTADDGVSGRELWKASLAGASLVKDVYAGPISGVNTTSFFGEPLINVSGTLYFPGEDPSSGRELWQSDGTAVGTGLVKDIRPGILGSNPGDFSTFNGSLLFTADDGLRGRELWKSSGTATVLVRDINLGGAGITITAQGVQLGNSFYLSIDDETTGSELWKTDGTANGTFAVSDIEPGATGSGPEMLTVVNGNVIFSAANTAAGRELWVSDGTSSGTRMVLDIRSGTIGSNNFYPQRAEFTDINGSAFFTLDNRLWKADGNGATPQLVAENLAAYQLTRLGGTLFFGAFTSQQGGELWKSDGTPAGTGMVRSINPGSASASVDYLTDCGGVLYFSADDGVNGPELWRSDGTVAGTTLVASINPGNSGADPRLMTNVGGLLYFVANDGVHGDELWKSDGSVGGTVLVKDITPGSNPSYIFSLESANGRLFFTYYDNVSGEQLWTSDGTLGGTVPVKNIWPSAGAFPETEVAAVGGILFFTAFDNSGGVELWRSDGTSAGTFRVADINLIGSSYPSGLTSVGSMLFFLASDGVQGQALWKSDGTVGGTRMVKSAPPLGFFSSSTPAVDFNGKYVFAGDDGVHGVELWISDGSASGTFPVHDTATGLQGSHPVALANANGILYFMADDGVHGYEPWTLRLDAAAAMPLLTVANGSGNEDTGIDLSITAALTDTDGSETLSDVSLGGLPIGGRLSNAANGANFFTATSLTRGISLTSAQLVGLKLTAPAHVSGVFSLSAAVTSTEVDNGALRTATAAFTVTATAAADLPTLGVSDAAGNQDSLIPLAVSAGLVDTDGSETLSITLSGIPVSARLSNIADGANFFTATLGNTSRSLTVAQLSGLGITPPPGSSANLSLSVSATSREASNGMTATATVAIRVDVNGAPASNSDTFILSPAATSSATAPQGLLANDSDPDGESITAVLVQSPARGTLTVNADGSFSYSRGANFRGVDRFAYRAFDSRLNGSTVSVTLVSHEGSLVRKLYQQVLGREPEDAGLEFWTGLILAGRPVSVISQGIFESDERLDPIIGTYYQQFLLRTVEPSGLAFWRDKVWKRDGGPENVVAGMIVSDEFFRSAQAVNPHLSPEAAWVTELYRRLLNREPETSGLDFWVSELRRGRTREQIVLGFVRSDENFRNLIHSWHLQYLGRGERPEELAAFLLQLRGGASHRQIQISLIDSAEFRNSPPPPAVGTVLKIG